MTETHKIRLDKTFAGETVALCEKEIEAYLEATDEMEICRLLEQNVGKRLDKQAPVFSWQGESETYFFHVANKKDFSDERRIRVNGCRFRADALFPDLEYYYRVTDEKGNSSAVDCFRTNAAPVRYLTLSCAENVRDTGGWKTESGKRVAYGKLYRGGRVDGACLVQNNAELCAWLGIRSELDLRNPGGDDGGQICSSFGEHVAYVRAPLTQSCYVFPFFKQTEPYEREYDGRTPESLRTVFALLSDERNYPVYYHCNAGADRTGTLAFLLNGLLGVSYGELTKDFELTTFSAMGFRLRSEIRDGRFTESGVMQDNYYNYVAWGKLYETMISAYPTKENTLSASIERYLTEVCAVPSEQLESFKAIMLRG